MLEALGVFIGIIVIVSVEVFALIAKDKIVRRNQFTR